MNYTDPHDMKDMAIFVMGWDEDGVVKQAKMFESQGYPNVFRYIDKNHHEAQNVNIAMGRAAEQGFKFFHMVNDDVIYRYKETLPAMYDYIKTHPNVGAIHPWIEGEDADPSQEPYEFYLQDATAILVRLDINGWLPVLDEEYLFIGWVDLDWGADINRHGMVIMNDRRYPVKHLLDRTKSRSQKPFLFAMERRNRLILTAKWDVVGIDRWHGVEEYNKTVPPEKRIPTMYEIANYTAEEQDLFGHSIVFEHPPIYKMDGQVDPTLYWVNPILTGINIREKWEQGWRPT